MLLVDMLQYNGVCISYHRVIQISAQLGDAPGRQSKEDGDGVSTCFKKTIVHNISQGQY